MSTGKIGVKLFVMANSLIYRLLVDMFKNFPKELILLITDQKMDPFLNLHALLIKI